MILKRVGVGSAARLAGAIYGGLGLVFGAIFACAALLGSGLAKAGGGNSPTPPFFGVIFGVGAIIFVPVFYGLIGALIAAFAAWLYNTFAKLTGGLELDLE